jgi:hypothetical protein
VALTRDDGSFEGLADRYEGLKRVADAVLLVKVVSALR